jgi:RNA polymerase sigma-70 factor (ECF subfamily)
MDGASSYNRFLNGDSSGLEDLVRLYNDSLILFINGLVNDSFSAEDLAADTFLELLMKKPRFREDSGKFKTWLFKIARNNAIDYIRKQKRHTTQAEITEHTPDTSNAPESLLLRTEREKLLHTAMSRLTADYRQVLHLIHFEEMSYEQAGKVMRKTIKQVKNLAYRARQSLKSELTKEGFEYEDL